VSGDRSAVGCSQGPSATGVVIETRVATRKGGRSVALVMTALSVVGSGRCRSGDGCREKWW
jgi:hypothetical protein